MKSVQKYIADASSKEEKNICLYDDLLKYGTEDTLMIVCKVDIHTIQYIYVHCYSPGCSCKQFMAIMDAGAITNTPMEKWVIAKGVQEANTYAKTNKN